MNPLLPPTAFSGGPALCRLGGVLALGAGLTPLLGAQDALAGAGNAPPEPEARAYRDYGAMVAQVDAWAAGIEGWTIERTSLGYSHSGLEIPVLVFGRAGPLALARRPTVLLVGGLDGVSLSGAEAVLDATAGVLAGGAGLPSSLALAAIPWASPDALTSWVAGRGGDGTNARPIDQDNDGRIDEDGPDDADGDGAILDMLIPDPLGPFARAEDGRRLRPAGVLDAERFRLVREGVDDDGDGSFNEDGPGGVELDRGFPIHWRGISDGVNGGPWPLSERATRALAYFVTSRKTVVTLLFQGSHGQCASPGGWARPEGEEWVPRVDRPVFEALTRLFQAATGRTGPTFVPLHVAREGERSGAALDWLYAAAGVAGVEVAMWGPGGSAPAGSFETAEDTWFDWVDNEHGGYLFRPWTPFDLGGGRLAWLGGWSARTRVNPPESMLDEALDGAADFVLAVAGAFPRLEFEVFERRRDLDRPELCHIGARLVNLGALPSGLALPGGALEAAGVLQLEWEEGCELLVGRANQRFDHVPGRGTSADFRWILTVPQGARLKLRAQDRWAAPVEAEVRP